MKEVVNTKSLKLGDTLVERGLISRKQLDEALKAQKKDSRKLGQILVDRGLVTEEKLTQALSSVFQISFLKLSEIKIDEAVLGMVSDDMMHENKMLPIAFENNCLTVAISDPLNVASLQQIRLSCDYEIKPVLACLSDIEAHLQEHADSIKTIHAIKTVDTKTTEGSDIVQLVESIIGKAIKEKASDIHFEPQGDHMRVRYRIDGVLHERTVMPKELERNLISRIKIISGMDVAENRRPQDGRTTMTYAKEEYDIRISSLPDIKGENLVLRLLSKKFAKKTFDALGMDDNEIIVTKKLMRRPYGMILVTGPTGSGKTTTLYAVLNMLNDITKNIITIEDPVEYELKGITQTAINTLSGYSFAKAMRHILRHDPDVIMVGEIRDVETAEIAIRAALTGHLVLSTMHTNNAAGAITRLLEMDIEPFLISSALNGVIAQRLVRHICPECMAEFTPNEEIIQNISKYIEIRKDVKFVEPVGCEQCLKTGFSGRVGIYELLEVTDDIRTMILKAANEQEIVNKALTQGMSILKVAGIKKAIAQKTTLEEVIRVTSLD